LLEPTHESTTPILSDRRREHLTSKFWKLPPFVEYPSKWPGGFNYDEHKAKSCSTQEHREGGHGGKKKTDDCTPPKKDKNRAGKAGG